MLNKIIHFSLQNRILVLVASVLLLIGGTYTAMHTEVDVFPDLNAPTVVIMTEANGMAAEEVEQLVTFPVETAVNGATGVRRVRSSSTNGFSVVWVEFDWETDVYLARQIVSEKLAVVSESLPSNVGKPTLGPQSSILGEMLIVGLTADSTSMLDLRTIADWTIRPRLLSTGGVAQVAVLGGDIKEYQIQLDPERMRHYGVTLTEVMNVTREMNLNANGGVLYEYGNEYIVRGVISTDRVEQLAKAVVKLQDGSAQPATSNTPYSASPILLEDIAAAMGQKGTMSALRRTSAGVYTEADAHTLEEILAAKEQGMDALEALMLPVESVFESLPLLVVEPWVEQHLYNGCPTSRYPATDGRYRVRNAAGQFLGLANIVQGVLRVEKLFVERN
jgi:Cu/Ag efflux pump CusA